MVRKEMVSTVLKTGCVHILNPANWVRAVRYLKSNGIMGAWADYGSLWRRANRKDKVMIAVMSVLLVVPVDDVIQLSFMMMGPLAFADEAFIGTALTGLMVMAHQRSVAATNSYIEQLRQRQQAEDLHGDDFVMKKSPQTS